VTNSVTTATVEPGLIDPAGVNFTARPARSTGGPLVVFLPATGQEPSEYQLLLRQAALAGEHAVGVSYPNARTVAALCNQVASCLGTARGNLFDGRTPSNASGIAARDSISGRLTALLHWLDNQDPGGTWSAYVNGTMPIWSRIVIAGHSQGGGEADYIAHVVKVAGVVVFSSPEDATGLVRADPAPWVLMPSATAPDRVFGFMDTRDTFARSITADWTALGLTPATSVDGS
jgi:hypothetical protein